MFELTDPEPWRRKAAALREEAEQTSSPQARREFLRLAAICEATADGIGTAPPDKPIGDPTGTT